MWNILPCPEHHESARGCRAAARPMASMVFGVSVADVTPELRGRIKATSYGLAYGLSPFFRISTATSEEVLNKAIDRIEAAVAKLTG